MHHTISSDHMSVPVTLKKMFSLVLSAMLLLLFGGCSPKKSSVKTEVPPKLVVLGDSIACYGNAFPEVLEERYKEELKDVCEHETSNMSVPGIGTLPLIIGLRGESYDLKLKEADAVVVVIGGNNFGPALSMALDHAGAKIGYGVIDTDRLDEQTTRERLEASRADIDEVLEKYDASLAEITELLNAKTNAKVYFLNYFNIVSELPGSDIISDYAKEYFDKFNEVIAEHANGNYTVIDLDAAFSGRICELTGMGVSENNHPNDAGSIVIADELDKAFRRDGFTFTR